MARDPVKPNAEVYYEMAYGPDPWHKEGEPVVDLWVLWKTTVPRLGLDRRQEPVAVFNLDSEARMFLNFIIDAGLEKALVRPPRSYIEEIRRL